MGGDIQAAINASTLVTDVVKVAGYCNVHDLNLSKNLTLQGGWRGDFGAWDPSVYTTTLDAKQLGRVLAVTGTISPLIEGSSITGGYKDFAGGISINTGSPIIQNNTFAGNQTIHGGGGIYISDGDPTIQNNLFTGNQAGGSGGGLYNLWGNPTIQNNTFSSNRSFVSSDGGGGLANGYGSPLI